MINVLERITEMREERHWSEYQLSEKSGLTQSTISSWYRKDMLPTLPSLMKICDAFGISISQFFLEDNDKIVSLNQKQLDLLTASAKLDATQYDALLHFLETL